MFLALNTHPQPPLPVYSISFNITFVIIKSLSQKCYSTSHIQFQTLFTKNKNHPYPHLFFVYAYKYLCIYVFYIGTYVRVYVYVVINVIGYQLIKKVAITKFSFHMKGKREEENKCMRS